MFYAVSIFCERCFMYAARRCESDCAGGAMQYSVY